MKSPTVRTGLDRLVAERFAPLRGRRVGLVTHPAAVDAHFRNAADLIAAADGVTLAALFGPEHGLAGTAQDLIGVGDARDPLTGVPQFSLYGDTVESLWP